MIDNRELLERSPDRAVALDCLAAGLAAGDPERVLRDRVAVRNGTLVVDDATYALDDVRRIVVVGAGKAAGRQARAIESILGDRIDAGLVVSTESVDCDRVRVSPGDHPIPSDRNVAATRELTSLVSAADETTLVVVLLSGGGSALLVDPADPVTLAGIRAVTTDLLESGASIDEINAVRKHLSGIKGGRLARRIQPATAVALAMSDVVGDDPGTIASGPTVPDETTYAEALAVLDRYGLEAPAAVTTRLEGGAQGTYPETPKPGDPAFTTTATHVIGTALTALDAAADAARNRGYTPLLLSSRIRGEARDAAGFHRDITEEVLATGQPCDPPAVLLSGGETTVTVVGDGQGGPNQEFAVAAAIDLPAGVTVGAVDTDGIDGSGPAAGGLVDATTVDDPAEARGALEANDAYPYLVERNDAIHTGQTGTNLNDLRVVVVKSPH